VFAGQRQQQLATEERCEDGSNTFLRNVGSYRAARRIFTEDAFLYIELGGDIIYILLDLILPPPDG
jgi:hypothetical protein